jgi:hypothetical protein
MSVVIESGAYTNNVSTITGVNGVRPMIIIDCVSTDIDYYADDYDDIENAGVTTRTEADVHWIGGSSGGSSSKCSSCNGTGKKVVTWYSEGDWGETSYSSYKCTA